MLQPLGRQHPLTKADTKQAVKMLWGETAFFKAQITQPKPATPVWAVKGLCVCIWSRHTNFLHTERAPIIVNMVLSALQLLVWANITAFQML